MLPKKKYLKMKMHRLTKMTKTKKMKKKLHRLKANHKMYD